MNAGKRPQGYTIIEVLIVLAVSGLMFIIAANFISGKQAKTSFTSGVNEMASRLQDTIDQVNDGKYSDIPLTCTAGAVPVAAAPTKGQGENAPCVFLGKALHFSVNGDPTKYEIFSLVGDRVNNNSLAAANPRAVDPLLTVQQTNPQNLRIDAAQRIGARDAAGTAQQVYGIAFLQGLGATDTFGNQANGTQSVGLYYLSTFMNPAWPSGTAASNISSGSLVKARIARLCLTDGDRFAEITLGLDNNRLIPKERYYPPGAAGCTDPLPMGVDPG